MRCGGTASGEGCAPQSAELWVHPVCSSGGGGEEQADYLAIIYITSKQLKLLPSFECDWVTLISPAALVCVGVNAYVLRQGVLPLFHRSRSPVSQPVVDWHCLSSGETSKAFIWVFSKAR